MMSKIKNALFVSVALSTSAAAFSAESVSDYVRLLRYQDGTPRALQTAVTHLESGAKSTVQDVRVDLVSAIHIGDAQYFETLQTILNEYEVVLYELVTKKDAEPGKVGQESVMGGYYGILKDALGLSFQLNAIDYTSANFKHADLPAEMVFRAPDLDIMIKSMNEIFNALTQPAATRRSQGKANLNIDYTDIVQLSGNPQFRQAVLNYWNAVRDAGRVGYIPQKEFINVLTSAVAVPSISIKAKQFLAEQMVMSFDNNVLMTVSLIQQRLISERNQRVVDVLEETLASGSKSIAVYYGAAHMPDMTRRIKSKTGFKKAGAKEWVTAWNLSL